MIPHYITLRKYNVNYKFTKLQENHNHLMYIDEITLFAKKKKNEQELETLIQIIRICSQIIGMGFSTKDVSY